MARTHYLLSAALLLILTACTTPPVPTATLTATATPTPTVTATPALTATATPTPTYISSPISTPTPTPFVSPISTPDADHTSLEDMLSVEPPLRPFDYTVVNPDPPRRVTNAIRTFWVADGTTGERREITARLRVQTEHAAMWIEEGVWHDVRQLEKAATFFETVVYSTTRAAFGSEWTPGVDNDPHIHILHTTNLGEGVLGYTSAADEFPRAQYPFSSQAEMIAVNLDYVEAASPTYYALLARQFQRLIQWFQDRNEERWVKEGLAELSVQLNGLDTGAPEQVYLEHPDTSLTAWGGEKAQREAAFLFAAYFHEQFGDAGTRALTAEPLNGTAGFDAVLAELDAGLTFEDLFAEWLAANYLDREQTALAAIYENYPVTLDTSVRQFGADYILLRGDTDLRVRFTGATRTPLLDALPRRDTPHNEHHFWWSNRADESLTTLTHPFDLSGVERATLTYWTWYDIEPGYDHVTVEVSTDDGEQWQIRSYTGQSGAPPGWIWEEIDLSPYAGREILVRVAYLTDEAISGQGFVIDDIAIPEIGYADDEETKTGGWEATGFVHSDNFVSRSGVRAVAGATPRHRGPYGTMPQRYLALLIGIGDTVTVERLSVDENQTAEWTVPLSSKDWRKAVIVLSGLAPFTTQPATYQLVIEK